MKALGGWLTLGFVDGAALCALFLWLTVPLDPLAVPTVLCMEEVAAAVALFIAAVVVMVPAKEAVGRSRSHLSRAMRHRFGVPSAARAAALVLFVFGAFFFAFWAAADVLGGYSGYSYSFSWYPALAWIYNNSVGLVPYISSKDKGTQASFYIGLAMVGIGVFRLDRGLGAALKDAITLFFAPFVVVFELALWSQAPEDMTWHVTDFLWVGGIADGGIRQNDFVRIPFQNYAPAVSSHFLGTYASGPYVFSNWILLVVGLLLVATRIPGLSRPSAAIWRRKVSGHEEEATEPALESGGPAGRTISAWGAFEPTTLRFLLPEQAERVDRGRQLQPEAFGSFWDLPG